MTELVKAIFARYGSDAGGPVRELVGKSGEMAGLYLGPDAPEGAPYPLVLFFTPSDGTTAPCISSEKETTLERASIQFSVFASTQTKVLAILDKLRDLYDRWSGPFGPEEARTGAIVSSWRRGPGYVVRDPDSGYDGFLQYTFTYWENNTGT